MLYFEEELLRIRAMMGYDTESSRRVVRVKSLIDRNFGEAYSLESLAREAMVSPFLFARRFRALYGVSPTQYINRVRIRHSIRLLSEGCSVAETCYRVGFGSPTTFSGLFKRNTGRPPSWYQRAGEGRVLPRGSSKVYSPKAGSER